MRKTDNVTAELRKAKKVLGMGVVTARQIMSLPKIARAEVLYRSKDWKLSVNRDALFHPAVYPAYQLTKQAISDALFKSMTEADQSSPIGGLQALV